MLTIGAFSRLSQTSVKTLRFYEARAVFRPAFVDPASGYRYYSADQVTELGQVLHLRALGFSLRQIRDALRDASRLRAMPSKGEGVEPSKGEGVEQNPRTSVMLTARRP